MFTLECVVVQPEKMFGNLIDLPCSIAAWPTSQEVIHKSTASKKTFGINCSEKPSPRISLISNNSGKTSTCFGLCHALTLQVTFVQSLHKKV